MRVEHLIDGRPVVGRSYFETVDPATQDVLAEVARGGAGRDRRGGDGGEAGIPGLGEDGRRPSARA